MPPTGILMVDGSELVDRAVRVRRAGAGQDRIRARKSHVRDRGLSLAQSRSRLEERRERLGELLLSERELRGRRHDRLARRHDRDLPLHLLAVQRAHEPVGPGRDGAREAHGPLLARVGPAAVVVGEPPVEGGLLVLRVRADVRPDRPDPLVARVRDRLRRVAGALREEVRDGGVGRLHRRRRRPVRLPDPGRVAVEQLHRAVGQRAERNRMWLARAGPVEHDRVTRMHRDGPREIREEIHVHLRARLIDVHRERLGAARSPYLRRCRSRGQQDQRQKDGGHRPSQRSHHPHPSYEALVPAPRRSSHSATRCASCRSHSEPPRGADREDRQALPLPSSDRSRISSPRSRSLSSITNGTWRRRTFP